jgi:hypothetical protein
LFGRLFCLYTYMKEYELKYEMGDEGIYVMSTVVKPAVKSTLVMFSDEKQVFEFADDEKQIIYSVAMRPNTLIPRENINGAPANVFYTEETADALLQNFFEKNAHQGATIDHGGEVVKDMFIFSAWKVLDPARDAATVMGLDVKRGDIVMGQKVNNPEVWKRIKNKELTGFSFEAILNPVLTKTQTQMSAEEIDARIKEVIKMTAEEDALAMKKAEDDAVAMAAHDDMEKKKMEAAAHTPEGTHEMPDGSVMPDADMPAAAAPADMQKMIDDLTTENISLKAQIAELEAVSLTMSAENSAAKKVALEMSAQLGKGITPNGGAPAPVKTYAEMSNLEKTKFNRGI